MLGLVIEAFLLIYGKLIYWDFALYSGKRRLFENAINMKVNYIWFMNEVFVKPLKKYIPVLKKTEDNLVKAGLIIRKKRRKRKICHHFLYNLVEQKCKCGKKLRRFDFLKNQWI